MRILAFGDSITLGMWDYEAGGWVNRIGRALGVTSRKNPEDDSTTIYNLGVSGNSSREILERFENEIMTKSNPELRFFLAENKIKYEAFLEWQDKIKELRNNIPHPKTDTIGSMFEQSVFQDKVTEQANRNLYRN